MGQVTREGHAPASAAGRCSPTSSEPPDDGAVTAVLFDRLNTSLADQRPARDQTVRTLAQIRARGSGRALRARFDVAAHAARFHQRHGGADPRRFAKQRGREPLQLDTSEGEAAGLGAFLLGAAQDMTQLVMRSRIVSTAARALDQIARHLAGIRGRKNLDLGLVRHSVDVRRATLAWKSRTMPSIGDRASQQRQRRDLSRRCARPVEHRRRASRVMPEVRR